MIKWSVLVVLALLLTYCGRAEAFTPKEQRCLYNAIFYEANLESMAGKKAVWQVVVNRAEKKGVSVCSVVRERGQFSWWGKKPYKALDASYYHRVVNTRSPVGLGVVYFHNIKVKPKWARKMLYVATIGRHRFYKEA